MSQVVGQITTELFLISPTNPLPTKPIFKRIENIIYNIDIHPTLNRVYIHTNAGDITNHFVFEMHLSYFSKLKGRYDIETAFYKYGTKVYAKEDEFIEKMQLFEKWLVLWVRKNGLRVFKVLSIPDNKVVYEYKAPGSVYSLYPSNIGDMVPLLSLLISDF